MNEIQQPALLRAEGVFKTFRANTDSPVEVLRGASLVARAGEMIAVTGASGSGKSTLLHVLGGLERADAGRVWVGDYELTAEDDLARARNELIGFVFQFHHLLPDLTAAENVALPLLIARRPRRASRERAEVLLAEVGLADCAARRVTELSGGEQQRVAFARALANRPRLLLADEPTGNLDAAHAEQCAQLLRRLCRAHGLAAVVATHSSRLARACDRRFALEGGRLVERSSRPDGGGAADGDGGDDGEGGDVAGGGP